MLKKMLLIVVTVITLSLGTSPAMAQEFSVDQWVAWFNVQDAYLRCTANVAPPVGFYWGSNCLMVPYY